MTRRKRVNYSPPPAPVAPIPAPRPSRDPLAWLDEPPDLMTVEFVAEKLQRTVRAVLEDDAVPKLPYNQREKVILREELRDYLEQRMEARKAPRAALMMALRLTPSPIADADWGPLLGVSDAIACELLNYARSEASRAG